MMSTLFQDTRMFAGVIACLMIAHNAQASGTAEQSAQVPVAAAPVVKDVGWTLGMPKEEKVIYKGVVSFDQAGTDGGAFLYPAPNIGGFLAAIITHAVIVDSMKDSQKSKLQEKADQVLAPLQPILNNYTYKELMNTGLNKTRVSGSKKLVDFSENPKGDGFIESTPVFSMSQDQKTIILENMVSIYAARGSSPEVYQNVVRVVSQTRDSSDLVGYWSANEGERLKEESASLLAHSLEIAVTDAAKPAGAKAGPDKTFRYHEGETLRIERGQLLSESCNRTVLKTLRGWIMSIPVQAQASATGNSCSELVSSLK